MAEPSAETVIAIGWTDGFRYIGITDTLTGEEVDRLGAAGAIQEDYALEHIDALESPCTLIRLGGLAFERLTPAAKNGYAEIIAIDIAAVLRSVREGRVRLRLDPVPLIGHQSTPFNPDTDHLPAAAR